MENAVKKLPEGFELDVLPPPKGFDLDTPVVEETKAAPIDVRALAQMRSEYAEPINPITKVFELNEKYLDAPTRAAISASMQGNKPYPDIKAGAQAFGKQFGKETQLPPSELTHDIGLPPGPVSDFIVQSVASPINLLPVGEIAKGVGKGAELGAQALRGAGKYATEQLGAVGHIFSGGKMDASALKAYSELAVNKLGLPPEVRNLPTTSRPVTQLEVLTEQEGLKSQIGRPYAEEAAKLYSTGGTELRAPIVHPNLERSLAELENLTNTTLPGAQAFMPPAQPELLDLIDTIKKTGGAPNDFQAAALLDKFQDIEQNAKFMPTKAIPKQYQFYLDSIKDGVWKSLEQTNPMYAQSRRNMSIVGGMFKGQAGGLIGMAKPFKWVGAISASAANPALAPAYILGAAITGSPRAYMSAVTSAQSLGIPAVQGLDALAHSAQAFAGWAAVNPEIANALSKGIWAIVKQDVQETNGRWPLGVDPQDKSSAYQYIMHQSTGPTTEKAIDMDALNKLNQPPKGWVPDITP